MPEWYSIHKPIDIIHHISKTKDKNHMIISIDVEKTFDKVQHPFVTETLSKVRIQGAFLNIIKAIYETYSQHHIQWAKTENFPTKMRNKTRLSTFTTSIQHSIGSSSHSN